MWEYFFCDEGLSVLLYVSIAKLNFVHYCIEEGVSIIGPQLLSSWANNSTNYLTGSQSFYFLYLHFCIQQIVVHMLLV